jgi:hypothetical protein
MSKTTLLREAVTALNAMMQKDDDAMNRLFALRVVASNALCLCRPTHAKYHEEYPTVKLIGAVEMLNAVCATDTAYISPVMMGDTIVRFEIVGGRQPRTSPTQLSAL